MDEAKPFGQIIRLPTSATVSPVRSIRSFTLAGLARLPDRLDQTTQRQLRAFYRSAPPPEQPADGQSFAECLRTMRACLPTRPADELDGQLMLAMYRRHLGTASTAALDYLAYRATRDCRWFPTIHECLELIADYRRSDEALEARGAARALVHREDRLAAGEERAADAAVPMTQAEVDATPEHLIGLGIACGALVRNADGTVSPAENAA